jgi:PadR family transcriptional regulator AphA
MPERELTTTSYAILGLLAIKPWSTYELAAQMRRNLHYFWPRAASNLYAEPKRLVEEGFATARPEPVGRRRRTVYSITPKGRRALEHWLREPAGESRLESETLVKAMFAPHGSKEDLLGHLHRLLDELEAKQQQLRRIFDEYLAGDEPFPERAHINVVCYRLIWDYTQTAASWAAWAIHEVEQWPDVTAPADRHKSMKILEDALAANAASANETREVPAVPGVTAAQRPVA